MRPAFALLLLAATLCFAEESRPDMHEPAGPEAPRAPAEAGADPSSSPDYSFEMDEKGEPLFTQHLRWDGNLDALRYEFVLYDAKGTEIDRRRTTGDHVDLSLHPGTYSYEVFVYNLLDQEEARSGRTELVVQRAEIPSIKSFRPGKINMEGEEPAIVTIDGEYLMPGARIELVDLAKNATRKNIQGTVIKRQEENETAAVEFPAEKLQFGRYRIRIQNPGGLTVGSDKDILVRYRKPVDFYFSGSYEPVFPIYDSFNKSVWPDSVYPLGVGAKAGLYFLKLRSVFFGMEFQGTLLRRDGGRSAATLVTKDMTLGGNFVCSYHIGKAFRIVGGVGGGIDLVSLEFDYDGTSGDSMRSYDPFMRVGLSGRLFFGKHMYVELGADWTNVFRDGYKEGQLSPIAAGGLYF
jgi:hypothetical protein